MGHEEETISHSREKVTDREGVVAERQCAAGFSFRRREMSTGLNVHRKDPAETERLKAERRKG